MVGKSLEKLVDYGDDQTISYIIMHYLCILTIYAQYFCNLRAYIGDVYKPYGDILSCVALL